MTSAISSSRSDIDQWLQLVDRMPSLSNYAVAARQIRGAAAVLRKTRMSLLASFTMDALVPYLEVEAARIGFAADLQVAPQGPAGQQLLDPDSICHRQPSDVVLLAQLLSDVCPPLAHNFLSLNRHEVCRQIDNSVNELAGLVKAFREQSSSTLVVHNFPIPADAPLGIHEVTAPHSQTAAIRRLNKELAESLQEIPGVLVLDFDRLCGRVGYDNWLDEKSWYLWRAPLSSQILAPLAREHMAFVAALHGTPKKCLVVDLDQTIWGGILGEDKATGLQVGSDYPGVVYRDIQRQIKQLHERGILLAINSSNNPADVHEAFEKRTDLPLRLQDFACIRANWQSKSQNMIEIADELNLGLDTMVFLDDSPAQCELMRQSVPQVLTIQASDSGGSPAPIKTLGWLRGTKVFDRLSLTDEDRRRTRMYRQDMRRRRSRESAISRDEFLASLNTRISITAADAASMPRVHQLIHRTNQFNLTTRRHSAAELDRFLQLPDSDVLTLRLKDRFGDSGVVGVAILRYRDQIVTIDTLLLSCRVIGRDLETALLCHLLRRATDRGALMLEGEFVSTPKNDPASGFYRKHGFTEIRKDNDRSFWRLTLQDNRITWPQHIASELD